MNILKQIGWWTYAVLMSILTLGIFIRFHLVTVRKRTLGGVRAGTYGGTHVYRTTTAPPLSAAYLVVSTWYGKKRFPVTHISFAQTKPFAVVVASTGTPVAKLNTWQTRTVANFINTQIPMLTAHP